MFLFVIHKIFNQGKSENLYGPENGFLVHVYLFRTNLEWNYFECTKIFSKVILATLQVQTLKILSKQRLSKIKVNDSRRSELKIKAEKLLVSN